MRAKFSNIHPAQRAEAQSQIRGATCSHLTSHQVRGNPIEQRTLNYRTRTKRHACGHHFATLHRIHLRIIQATSSHVAGTIAWMLWRCGYVILKRSRLKLFYRRHSGDSKYRSINSPQRGGGYIIGTALLSQVAIRSELHWVFVLLYIFLCLRIDIDGKGRNWKGLRIALSGCRCRVLSFDALRVPCSYGRT